jgi:hypothetical protein
MRYSTSWKIARRVGTTGRPFTASHPSQKTTCRAQAEVHVYTFPVTIDINCPNIRAICQRAPRSRRDTLDLEGWWTASHDDGEAASDAGCNLKQPVFVGVVELVQQPEWVSSARRNSHKGRHITLRLPSVVWLKPLQERLLGIAHIRDRSLRVTPPFASWLPGSISGVEVNRKAGLFKDVGDYGVRPRVREGELARYVVKGGTEVEGELADENRPAQRWDIFAACKRSKRVFSSLWVTLADKGSVSVSFDEGFNLGGEGREVLLSPVSLLDGPPLWMHIVSQ